MAKATKEDVLAALDRVIDPVTSKSVTSGLVQGLVVRDGNVGFAIEVPESRGRDAEPLRKACEEAVARLPGVLSVTAVLTAHHDGPPAARPHSHAHAAHNHSTHNQAGARRPYAEGTPQIPKPQGIPGVAKIIAVASGKGGVGKSTVAANLALGLARIGLKTGLLDADIYGPSVPRLLGITDKPQKEGDKIRPVEKHGIKIMSIGFFVDEESPTIWRGPMASSALKQMMNDVDWSPLDVLVVDMPPGTGDVQLTMAQSVPLKGAVIVSTPQDIALIDARKGIAMFQKTAVPILGVVENMSVFVCPECGHESHIFGSGGARATAKELGVPFLGEIPLVPAIRETSDAGTPIVAQAPHSKEAQAFLALAQQVAENISSPVRAAPRIVME